MKMRDFNCNDCSTVFEDLCNDDKPSIPCPNCGGVNLSVVLVASSRVFTRIIPTHMNSKKSKAGYVHTHGDRPATPGKIQVGYGSDK